MRPATSLLLPVLVFALAGCLGQGGGPSQSGGIPAPPQIQNLPADGEMTVSVYLNQEAVPHHTRRVEGEGGAVELEFIAPEGEHIFTVVFEYLDPQFVPAGGGAWEVARWTSGTVLVVSGEAVPLEITEYVFEDFDGDGISNLEELIARTDPADPNDPGGPGSGGPPAPPPVRPDGIWRGETPQQADLLAVLHAGRIFMTAGNLIYEGSYSADTGGAFSGSVDIVNDDGDKLHSQVPLSGARIAPDRLALAVGGSGGLALELGADPAYGRGSDMDRIARFWTASERRPDYLLVFPVDGNGVITGAFDTAGCLYSGEFEVLDPGVNVYGVTLGLSDQVTGACGAWAGDSYSGYATLLPDDESLYLVVADGERALSLGLGGAPGEPPGRPAGGAWAVAKDGRILRWDGAGWESAARASRQLHDIHCAAPDDCWAVGEERGGRATILRWDGSDWSSSGFVNDTPDEDLYSVACVSRNDCWAVGEEAGRRANIVRWDGTSWSSSGFINDTPGEDLHGVTCIASDDCWAVGEDHRRRAVVVRWDGVAWSDAGFENSTPDKELNGVSCGAADDCWAVGETERGSAVIVRWDGRAWSASGFDSAVPNRELESVSCLSATDCWAVGAKGGGSGTIVRWNGAAWASVAVEAAPDEDLTAVHCARSTCWAVGKKGVALRQVAGGFWSRHDTGGEDLRGVFVTD